MHKGRRITISAVLVGLILIVSLIGLDRVPAPWWDEGWTMNVAKNWVEHGWYGQLPNGELAPPGLSAAFPTVASVALSFKVFGIGAWQARLPGVIYAVAAVWLLYYLASNLFNRRVALATLVLVLFAVPDSFLHPLYLGRQVLAEMPMMFYLLAGYACFWLALRRSRWFLLPAIALWGIGLITKAQPVPFWVASLLIPLALALFNRQWSRAAGLFVALAGSYACSQAWLLLQGTLVPALGESALSGLYDVTAAVLIGSTRVTVLILAVQLGLLPALGLAYGGWQLARQRRADLIADNRQLLRLMALIFAASWFFWYVFLSAGTPRYGFPATFVGSIFAAALLADVTDQFNWRSTLRRLSLAIQQRHFRARDAAAVLLTSLLIAMVVLNLKWVASALAADPRQGQALVEVTNYLNSSTPPAALVETYEPELFLYLDRRYHYPPDQLHVELIRRLMLDYRPEAGYSQFDASKLPMAYDPLSADPDYLVVGTPTELWHRPYDAILATTAFKEVYANLYYHVYQRSR